ncbi:MAG: hypothetical protein QOF13_1506 [Solirubrobacterales bacterium]|nr:hypothetical protein [Solirubrobacterales bacterium]
MLDDAVEVVLPRLLRAHKVVAIGVVGDLLEGLARESTSKTKKKTASSSSRSPARFCPVSATSSRAPPGLRVPAGPAGAKGNAGVQGALGPKGDPGAKGDPGDDRVNGKGVGRPDRARNTRMRRRGGERQDGRTGTRRRYAGCNGKEGSPWTAGWHTSGRRHGDRRLRAAGRAPKDTRPTTYPAPSSPACPVNRWWWRLSQRAGPVRSGARVGARAKRRTSAPL